MREYQIITDTNSDLPPSYIQEHGLITVPQYYTVEDVIYEGAGGMEPSVFYQKMREGQKPQSQAINPAVVEEEFRSVLESGKDILYISFASTLSGSFNTAVMVAREQKEEYGDAKILLVDSCNISLSEGLLVNKAVQMQKQGKSLEENAEWLEKNKLHICVQFTVDDLHHLQRGGRVSKTTAVVGSILSIKPIMRLSGDSKLEAVGTVRGRKKSLLSLVDYMEERSKGFEPQNDLVGIVHGDCLEEAKWLAEQVKSRLGVPEVMICDVNPSIGVHSGPGAMGLMFFGSSRD